MLLRLLHLSTISTIIFTLILRQISDRWLSISTKGTIVINYAVRHSSLCLILPSRQISHHLHHHQHPCFSIVLSEIPSQYHYGQHHTFTSPWTQTPTLTTFTCLLVLTLSPIGTRTMSQFLHIECIRKLVGIAMHPERISRELIEILVCGVSVYIWRCAHA